MDVGGQKKEGARHSVGRFLMLIPVFQGWIFSNLSFVTFLEP